MAETTTRAYTLKLQGDRLLLWRNHVIFNKGVRAWGEWLLNLRGGLPASLADEKELIDPDKGDVAKAGKERTAQITPASVRLDPKFISAADREVRAEVARRKGAINDRAIAAELKKTRRAEVREL